MVLLVFLLLVVIQVIILGQLLVLGGMDIVIHRGCARNYVTSGGTASGWTGSTVQPPNNGFHGVGVLGRSGRFISIVNNGGTHYFAWVTTGGASLQYAIPTTTGATVQQYPNGCATCDYDSTVNKIRVRIYNSSSGWSTMYAATEYSPVNMLNYGYRKIITY